MFIFVHFAQVVKRKTINKKEGVDALRLFLQAKFIKGRES